MAAIPKLSKVTRHYLRDFSFRLAVFLFVAVLFLLRPEWLDFTWKGFKSRERYMAVASPSVSGLVAIMTSDTPPAATRSTRDLMCRSSGPTWFMGEITPWSTW